MVTKLMRLSLSLLLLLPTMAFAVPQCDQVFTNPPTGPNNPGLAPPADLPASSGSFSCRKRGRNTECNQNDNFGPGDVNFSNGDFDSGSYIVTSGATTRLYFDNLTLKNADLNDFGRQENLLIFVRGNLYVNGHNSINGILYVEGNIIMRGNATINGAVAVNGSVPSGGNFEANIDLSLLDKADFGGMCTNAPSGPDHYRLSFSSQALSCKAQPVTIQACSDSNCASAFASTTTVSITKNASFYSTLSFSGSTSVDVWHGPGGRVTLGLTNPSPAATNGYRCYIDGNMVSNANCQLTYEDSGLLFDVPDKLANKPQNVTISAVRKSDSSLQCVPAFANVTKSVGFWSGYISPAAVNPAAMTVKDISAATATTIGKSEANRTPVQLMFNASGIATMEVNYPEAGQLQLDARLDGVGADAGLVMLGSDQFVNFPVGLCVTPKDSGALCAAGDASCNVYKKAGQAFDLNIHAKAWQSDGDSDYCDNLNTSNYAHDAISLSSELVAPIAGVQGTVGTESYHHLAVATSQNAVSQSISEVGVFKFTAKPPSSYLGSSFYDIPLAKSANIGRFVPDRYVVTSSSVLPACGMGSFSYMDQPFPLAFDVTAVNVNDGVTQNYRDGFAKVAGILVGENNQEGIDRQHRLNLVPLPLSSSSWVEGMAEIDYLPVFSRLTPLVGNESDGPYELMDVGIILNDQDGGVTLVDTPDMNADTSDDCSVSPTSCNAKRLSATPQRYRHGRVVMDNTYGPETEVLRMPVRAEYWQGSQWIINSEDSCTTVSAADAGLATQVDDTLLGYVFAPALSAGQTINRDRSALAFANGEFSLLWQSVTSGGASRYRGQVTAPFKVQDWLKWYWNWDGVSATTLSDPRASAFFGRYRGHDKIIYWREVN